MKIPGNYINPQTMIKCCFISPQLRDKLRAFEMSAFLRCAVCLFSIILDFFMIAFTVFGIISLVAWNTTVGLILITLICIFSCVCSFMIYWRRRKEREENDNTKKKDLQ